MNFRQQFIRCFLKCRNAMCSLIEAVEQTSYLNSFVELSLVIEFEEAKHERAQVEKWHRLRFRAAKEVVEIKVLRSQIHLEREVSPKPGWYEIHNGTEEKTQLKRCYETVQLRWTVK